MSELLLNARIDSLYKGVGEFSEASRASRPQSPAAGGASQTGASFLETLKGQLADANESLRAADKASQDFAAGKGRDLHDVMIAMEKADVSLRTITAVRNKAVEAYQEIMRMPV
jgi:flagellar hook-basal body complex protein FliE